MVTCLYVHNSVFGRLCIGIYLTNIEINIYYSWKCFILTLFVDLNDQKRIGLYGDPKLWPVLEQRRVLSSFLPSDYWGSTCPRDLVIRNQLNNNKRTDRPINGVVVCVEAAHHPNPLIVHVRLRSSTLKPQLTHFGAEWPFGFEAIS